MPAPTTTVAATTTTVVRTTKDFPYEIVPMDVADYDPSVEWAWADEDPSKTYIPQHAEMYDFNREYYVPIPDDGTYPIDGRNPLHPDSLTLREFSELPIGTDICVRGGNGRVGADVNFKVQDRTTAPFVSPSAVVFQKNRNGGRVNYLALLLQYDDDGGTFYDAAQFGIVNYPLGVWDQIAYVVKGRC